VTNRLFHLSLLPRNTRSTFSQPPFSSLTWSYPRRGIFSTRIYQFPLIFPIHPTSLPLPTLSPHHLNPSFSPDESLPNTPLRSSSVSLYLRHLEDVPLGRVLFFGPNFVPRPPSRNLGNCPIGVFFFFSCSRSPFEKQSAQNEITPAVLAAFEVMLLDFIQSVILS